MSWVEIFVLLFVTVGPVRPSLAYLGLTKSAEPSLKRAIAIRAVSVAALVGVCFALLGAGILAKWQVSVDALLIAGGAILFVSALQMVIGEEKQGEPDGPPPAPSLDTAVFPLAAPTIATPHGLVAIVAIEGTLQAPKDTAIFIALLLGMMVINLVSFLLADRIFGKIPPAFLKIVIRVLGVLLSAMAVQFIIFGLDGLGLIPNPEIDVNN